jgi:hypothetical protein
MKSEYPQLKLLALNSFLYPGKLMYRRFNLLVSKDKHDTDEEEHLCQKKSISAEEHDTDEVVASCNYFGT